MSRLLIIGITGRMGQAISRLAEGAGFSVVAGVALGNEPDPGVPLFTPEQIKKEGFPKHLRQPEVLIDFSGAGGFLCALDLAHMLKVPLVSGSTGLNDEQIRAFLELSREVPVLLGSNMSLGVNLLLSLLPQITEALGEDYDTEITEIHHNMKKDAPSGTALSLLEAIQTGTFRAGDTVLYGRDPQTPPRGKEEIAVHGIRGGDVIGDHTVFFFGPGERIELTHRAHTRDTFARGALRAARFLINQHPGRYTMADVLGIRQNS